MNGRRKWVGLASAVLVVLLPAVGKAQVDPYEEPPTGEEAAEEDAFGLGSYEPTEGADADDDGLGEAAASEEDEPEPGTRRRRDLVPPAEAYPTATYEAPAEPVDPVVVRPLPPPEKGPLGLLPSASFFTRFESRDGYDRLGVSRGRWLEGDWVVFRTRFGLATLPVNIGGGSSISLQFTPQASGVWGTLPNTVSDAAVGLHEGYLRLQSNLLRLDVGRFAMDYGDSLVIGRLDWDQTARSFDGARTRFTPGSTGLYIDAFFTQVEEGIGQSIPEIGAGDGYFTGVYVGLGPALAQSFELDLYTLVQVWPFTRLVALDRDDPRLGVADQQTAAQATGGSRIKHRVGFFDYRAEAGLQVGHRPRPGTKLSAVAYQLDAEAGINVIEHKFRFALEGMYASGDNLDTDQAEGWDQLYPTAHKWLGLSDIIGPRTNVYGGAAHARVKLADSLSLNWQGHVFLRPQHAGTYDYAGSEIDTNLVYELGEGLRLRSLWAHFIADRHHYPGGRTANYLELELRYDYE